MSNVETAPGWEKKAALPPAVQAAAAKAAMKASSAAGRQRPPMTGYFPPVTLGSVNTTKVSGTPVRWSLVAGLPAKRRRKSRKTRKTRKTRR